MFFGTNAYLYKGKTVVLNKSDIENATDDEFTDVTLYISEQYIRDRAQEVEYVE